MTEIQGNVTGRKRGENRPLPPSDVVLTYNVRDATLVSSLSRASIYRAFKSGTLQSVFVAGRRLIPAKALQDFLAGGA